MIPSRVEKQPIAGLPKVRRECATRVRIKRVNDRCRICRHSELRQRHLDLCARWHSAALKG